MPPMTPTTMPTMTPVCEDELGVAAADVDAPVAAGAALTLDDWVSVWVSVAGAAVNACVPVAGAAVPAGTPLTLDNCVPGAGEVVDDGRASVADGDVPTVGVSTGAAWVLGAGVSVSDALGASLVDVLVVPGGGFPPGGVLATVYSM